MFQSLFQTHTEMRVGVGWGWGEMRLTRALGYISRCVAFIRKAQSKSSIDLKAKARIIPILHQYTQTLLALLHHPFEPGATIRRRRFRVAANISKTRREADQLVGAFRPVLRHVRPHNTSTHRYHEEDSAKTHTPWIHWKLRSEIMAIGALTERGKIMG